MPATIDLDAVRAALEERHPVWVPRTLSGLLDDVAACVPARPFVIDDDAQTTYAELRERSWRIARGLVAAGVGPGDRVALLLPNSIAAVAGVFAIARAGAIAVPLNVRLHERELRFALEHSRSVALLCVATFRDALIAASLDALAPGWDGAGGPADLGALRTVVLCDGRRRRDAPLLEDFERAPEPELDAELARRADATDPHDTATIFYTSGTTGLPKGVVLTHDMQLRSAYGSAYTRAFEDGRRIAFALPLHHVFAYVEGLLASLFVGGAIVVQAAFDPVDALRAIERHRAAEALFVPTMTLAVVEEARAGEYDLASLHAVMSAAAVCPARLWRDVVDVLGVSELVTGYGMTETAAATTFTMPHDPIELMVETVGRPKPAGVAGAADGLAAQYRTIDPETGTPLPDGAVGELVARGPIVTTGYLDAPDETAAAFDADGWLRSGDLGRIRPDGYVELTGRGKDLYKCGGELVMPAEVEAVITELDGVSQAHVVAVPDERMGEVGCAFVVAADGIRVAPAAILAHCRDQLARFKVPAHVRFCAADELPLTASGKVRKFVLADRAARELAQPPRPPGVAIAAVAHAVPERVVTNAPIAARLGVDEHWIRSRTGTEQRHVLADAERLTDVALRAVREALGAAGIDGADLDLLLVGTTSSDEMSPHMAALLAAEIGATGAAIDLGAACTGFLSGVALAQGMIESGHARTVLVVGADGLSRYLDPDDRGSAMLFGDGAGAAVLRATDGAARVGPVVLHTDGGGRDLIRLGRDDLRIAMDGPAVYRRAVKLMVQVTHEALDAAALALDDVDLFVYHQANGRIIDAVRRKLGVDGERVLDVVGRFANTSAASLPIALSVARHEGRLAPGATVLLAAFGAGLVWGATVVRWPG